MSREMAVDIIDKIKITEIEAITDNSCGLILLLCLRL